MRHPLLLIFFFGGLVLAAQPLRIEYFTVNDGLSTREINDLHIGADGFLWVSTMDGLNRFDGQGFRVFDEGIAAEGGLSRGAIASVTPDIEGKFIVKFRDFFGYFDRFDPLDFSVEQVRMVPSTGVLGYPREVTTDALGRTFVTTIGESGTHIYEYTPKAEAEGRPPFTAVYHAPEDKWNSLTPTVRLLVLKNQEFLLYDEEYGFRHLSATGQLLARPFGADFRSRRFYGFAEGMDHKVYFSFRSGLPLYRWDPRVGGKPIAVENLDYGLRYPNIFRDKRGQLLLLATEDILGEQLPEEYYLIDTTGVVSLFEEPLPVNRKVTAMMALDFRETVYVGLREGLGVMERYVSPVTTFLDAEENNTLAQNNVRGVAEDVEGNVYFLEEEGGLYCLKAGAVRLDTLLLTEGEETPKPIGLRAGQDLVYDPQTHALWGTGQPRGGGGRARGGILFRYGIGSGITQVYRSPYALGALCFASSGDLYVAGSDPTEVGVLLRFNRAEDRFYPTVLGDADRTRISGMRINSLHLSAEGELLLGTANRGLVGYRPQATALRYYNITGQREDEQEAGSRTVHIVHEDTVGSWWVGTESGLYHYLPASETTVHYGRQEGLSNNIVYGIVPDSSGGFWLSTQNGLTHVPANRANGSFRRYYRENGLSNDQFLPFAYYRSRRDGRYFFGGVNGLSVFRDKDLSTSTAGADVMLTEINLYGRDSERIIAKNLDELRQVTAFAWEKSIAISFALPAGQLPSSSKFRYRLEGFNEEWRNLTNERTIRFNNLASGQYTLRIQGAGANGNFGDQETRLRINVRQYVVEQLWFQVFIVVLFAGLLIFIIQARLKERLRNEKLRTQLSSDIHDEVSGLLAGITL
ncbi:MAG: triple tyrosine motif-containing protein, partial [Bacteroidota bacterium]